jgi:tripartite-type tricarboxylate transporter receptor subunit TctC
MKEAAVSMLIRALVIATAMLCAAEAVAQNYPSRPIRLIVPFAAGGPTDVIARIVAQKLSESFGQQVYAEDMPGAGGNTGTATAARAPADGYTLLVISTGFIVNPSMYAKVPYDPIPRRMCCRSIRRCPRGASRSSLS